MAREDGKIRCNWCKKYKPADETHPVSVSGGANYKRSGRPYESNVCRQCCIDVADSTRASRYANPHGVRDDEVVVYGERLGGIKEACEYFGVPVDDLPNEDSDDGYANQDKYSKPKHPIDFSIFAKQYQPGDVEKIKAYWRSIGAVASMNKSSKFKPEKFNPDPDSKTEQWISDWLRSNRIGQTGARAIRNYQTYIYNYEKAKAEGDYESAEVLRGEAMRIRPPYFSEYEWTQFREDVLRQVLKTAKKASMNEQNTLSDVEVVEIAEEMGIKYEGRIDKLEYWSILGYEIVRNYQTGDYQIKNSGDVLAEGKGASIKNALRDFINNFGYSTAKNASMNKSPNFSFFGSVDVDKVSLFDEPISSTASLDEFDPDEPLFDQHGWLNRPWAVDGNDTDGYGESRGQALDDGYYHCSACGLKPVPLDGSAYAYVGDSYPQTQTEDYADVILCEKCNNDDQIVSWAIKQASNINGYHGFAVEA